MHGPNHLFCDGCDRQNQALVQAAWAGYFIAHNKTADANAAAQEALRLFGRTRLYWLADKGAIEVREHGESAWTDVDLTAVAEILALNLRAVRAREAKETLAAESPAAGGGEKA